MCGIELMSTSKLLDVDSSKVQQNLAYWPVEDLSFIGKLRQLREATNKKIAQNSDIIWTSSDTPL